MNTLSHDLNTTSHTSFLTDQYELTMLQASLESGAAHRKSRFELFGRRLPEGRRYGVVAGVGRALEGLQDFRFSDIELGFLSDRNIVNDQTLEYLKNFVFEGTITGYREGEIYFPNSPILSVDATFGAGCILETYLLSVLNHDCAIASAASRMTTAAGNRPCIEMGSRRTHEWAAVAAARAAVIAGFSSTSNLQAGLSYNLATVGTSAHSFTLIHDDEKSAFEAQISSLGKSTTLLVDTYDVTDGVKNAIELAGPELGAVRLDSGDLAQQAHMVRELLDSSGNKNTKILVTSDLDEYAIASLAAAPVDSYGVGTSVATGSGAPTAGMVYKLVSYQDDNNQWKPVGKKSKNKVTVGGKKTAVRQINSARIAQTEVVGVDTKIPCEGNDRDLIVKYMDEGKINKDYTGAQAVLTAQDHHKRALSELPLSALRLQKGEPAIPTEFINHVQ